VPDEPSSLYVFAVDGRSVVAAEFSTELVSAHWLQNKADGVVRLCLQTADSVFLYVLEPRWSPEMHRRMGRDVRAAVRTAMLVWQRLRCAVAKDIIAASDTTATAYCTAGGGVLAADSTASLAVQSASADLGCLPLDVLMLVFGWLQDSVRFTP